MSTINIVRFWKDEDYRLSLSEAVRAQMPENPAGMINLDDAELDNAELDLIAGGGYPRTWVSRPTYGCGCTR